MTSVPWLLYDVQHRSLRTMYRYIKNDALLVRLSSDYLAHSVLWAMTVVTEDADLKQIGPLSTTPLWR